MKVRKRMKWTSKVIYGYRFIYKITNQNKHRRNCLCLDNESNIGFIAQHFEFPTFSTVRKKGKLIFYINGEEVSQDEFTKQFGFNNIFDN